MCCLIMPEKNSYLICGAEVLIGFIGHDAGDKLRAFRPRRIPRITPGSYCVLPPSYFLQAAFPEKSPLPIRSRYLSSPPICIFYLLLTSSSLPSLALSLSITQFDASPTDDDARAHFLRGSFPEKQRTTVFLVSSHCPDRSSHTRLRLSLVAAPSDNNIATTCLTVALLSSKSLPS